MKSRYIVSLLVFLAMKAPAQVTCNPDFFSKIIINSDSTLEVLDVLALSNGDVIASGYYSSDTAEPILVNLNSNGKPVWQKRLALANRGYVFALEQSSDGNILAGGGIQGLTSGSLLVKLDTAGNVLWRTQEFFNDSENPRVEFIRQDDAGNIFTFTNFIENNLSFQDRFSVRKYNANGQLLWSRMITSGTGITQCWMYDVVFKNGAFYLAGRWNTGAFSEGLLLKVTAATGALEWTRLYNLNGKETTLDGILTTTDGFVLCGKNGLNGADSTVLFNIDANGALLSTHSFAFPVAEKPYATDAAGAIYFASGFRNAESLDRILVAKLSLQNGFEWANAYVTPQGFFQRVSSLQRSGNNIYFGGGGYRDDNKIYGHVSQVSVTGDAACPHFPVSIDYRTSAGHSRDATFFSVNKPVADYAATLTVEAADVAFRSPCTTDCSIVSFDRDAVSFCKLQDTLTLSFSKNAECLTAIDLNYNTSLYRLVDRTATSATLVALRPGTSSIYASINTICGIFQDSIRVSYLMPSVIDVNALPALDSKSVQVLRAPFGFSFIGEDGSRSDSFVVRNGGLNRLRLADACGNVVTDTVKYYPLRPGRLVQGRNLSTNAMVTYANAFSPNGDGRNDLYKPTVRTALNNYRFTVFDRAGQAVFTTTAPDKYWDGNGLPAGTYFYECVYAVRGGQPHVDKGTVILIR